MQRLPNGVMDFGILREDRLYYVDKTRFIEELEAFHPHVVLTRPRRFGKTLWLSVLEHYYDVRFQDRFEFFFRDLYIGAHPTRERNGYHVLRFDFSGIEEDPDPAEMRRRFARSIRNDLVRSFHRMGLDVTGIPGFMRDDLYPADLLEMALSEFEATLDHPIYVLVDEYDHFTQSLLASSYPEFRSTVGKGGFYRAFFEVLKTAAGNGVVKRSFITGVTPVTLDSMTSGFNIARDASVYPELVFMLGFREPELRELILATCDCPELPVDKVLADVAELYDGYRFTLDQEDRVYNPAMTLHYLSSVASRCAPPPKVLTSAMATDVGKLQELARAGDAEGNLEALERLATQGSIPSHIVDSFSLDSSFGVTEFVSMLFYMGVLTIEGPAPVGYVLAPPNEVVRGIHLRALYGLLAKSGGVSKVDESKLDMATMSLVMDGHPRPLLEQVSMFLKKLSNRDWIRFDERYLKLVLMMFLARYDPLAVKSEIEVTAIPGRGTGYLDLFVKRRDPTVGNFDVLFELKYLPKKDGTDARVAEAMEEARGQVRAYLDSGFFEDFQVAMPGDAQSRGTSQGRAPHGRGKRVVLPVAAVFRHHDLAAWEVVPIPKPDREV